MSSKNRVSINLSADEYENLARLAKSNNVSMAWIGRKAIADLIEYQNEERANLVSVKVREPKLSNEYK